MNKKEMIDSLDNESNSEINSNEENIKNNDELNEMEEIEVEKAKKILLEGTDEECATYFEKFGIKKEEILKKRNAIRTQVRREIQSRDLEEIQEAYPFVTAESIEEIPNFEKFVRLRVNGLSSVESFEGANGAYIAKNLAKNRESGDYNHLSAIAYSVAPKKQKSIPKSDLAIWKSAFPKENLAELTKKYNKQLGGN